MVLAQCVKSTVLSDLVVSLLQSHGQGREAVLGGQGLAGSTRQQEPAPNEKTVLGENSGGKTRKLSTRIAGDNGTMVFLVGPGANF